MSLQYHISKNNFFSVRWFNGESPDFVHLYLVIFLLAEKNASGSLREEFIISILTLFS